MPLVHSEKIEENSTLLLWKLTETEKELHQSLGSSFNKDDFETITHPQKKREWLASRILIKILVEQFGLSYEGTHKDKHGKAFLVNNTSHISITHTYDYVAAVINPAAPVGIDMEKTDPKLQRTSRKYLSEPEYEHAENEVSRLCMYWCAKEAIYKLYGKKKISFRNSIYIKPFSNFQTVLQGELSDDDDNLRIHSPIHIRWFEGYCLAVSV